MDRPSPHLANLDQRSLDQIWAKSGPHHIAQRVSWVRPSRHLANLDQHNIEFSLCLSFSVSRSLSRSFSVSRSLSHSLIGLS